MQARGRGAGQPGGEPSCSRLVVPGSLSCRRVRCWPAVFGYLLPEIGRVFVEIKVKRF